MGLINGSGLFFSLQSETYLPSDKLKKWCVTKIGAGFGYEEEIPLAKGRLCFSINGFSLHANTHINALDRPRLHQLIEYIVRGPISNERLEITSEGKVKLRLKTRWADGTTHLLFTPGEFIEKLMALTPPRKSHLVRWSGVLAPNAPFRAEITLRPEVKKGFQFRGEQGPGNFKNYSWSKMLRQVFKIDVTMCENCGSDMVALAAIQDPGSVRRYLRHQGLDPDPPKIAPARHRQGIFDFDQAPAETGDNVKYLD